MNVGVSYSADGKSWEPYDIAVNGYSDYGLQMIDYRGELWGLMVQNAGYKNKMFLNKFNGVTGKWTYFTTVSETAKSLDRATVAVLDDVLYVCWRSDTNIHLRWTTTVERDGQWTEAKIGGERFISAPAIQAYDGKLYVAALGDDRVVYYAATDANGKILVQWTKVPNDLGSDYCPALITYDGVLFCWVTGLGGAKVKAQTIPKLTAGTTCEEIEIDINRSCSSSEVNPSDTLPRQIDSGPSVTVWTGNNNLMVIAWRSVDTTVQYLTYNRTTKKLSADMSVTDSMQAKSEIGLASWGGKLIVSMGLIPGTFTIPSPGGNNGGNNGGNGGRNDGGDTGGPCSLQSPMNAMNEKSGLVVGESEDEDWDCKWKQQEENNGWVKKWFCM